MSSSARSTYRLKRFTSSHDHDFAAALRVYVRNTASNIRTDTNEITYWLDEFKAKFGDAFYVFGFYRDRQLVGYAEAAYLRDERLFVLDYIVIDEPHRRNNVFYEFVDQLKRYLEDANPEYRYGLVEVGYGSGQRYPSEESRLLTRLLKLQGFRVIRAPYYLPRLMLADSESEMRGDLLIYSTADLDRIQSNTYLSAVRAIYYKYYFRWKSIVPKELDSYKRHLDQLYSRVELEIGRQKAILINGHRSTLTAPQRRVVITLHRIVSFSKQSHGVIILVTAALLGLKAIFGLSNSSFAVIYVMAISSFFAVAGIVSKEARVIFGQFVSLAKHFSRKRIGDSTPNEPEPEAPSSSDLIEQ